MLDVGINVNFKNNYRSTALHYAASGMGASLSVLEVLVRKGADINCVDCLMKKTPLEYLIKFKNHHKADFDAKVKLFVCNKYSVVLFAKEHGKSGLKYMPKGPFSSILAYI